MRASQLDAARLDTELAAMLKEQFLKIFSFFQPRLISAFQPELTLILELLVGADCQNVLSLSSKMVGTMYYRPESPADNSGCVQIFRFSVWAGKPTPGSALMNLRYRDERHTHAWTKHLPSISTNQEQAHSPHDFASATQVVIWVQLAVHDATAYFCTCSV